MALADLINSFKKLFGHVDSKYQKQAFALIRACRKLQSDVRSLQDLQTMLELLKKVQEALNSWIADDKNSLKQVREGSAVITLADYRKLYPEPKAKAEWNIFREYLNTAKELDDSRSAKLHRLKHVQNKSTVQISTVNHYCPSIDLDHRNGLPIKFVRSKLSLPFSKAVAGEVQLLPVRSLPSRKVCQVISFLFMPDTLNLHEDSTFEEAIWLFSRAKSTKFLIKLDQNLQFYDPRLFKALNQRQLSDVRPVEKPTKDAKQKYWMVVDRSTRIYLELRRPRIFSNVWQPKGSGIPIFKEFNGTLLDSEKVRTDTSVGAFHVHDGGAGRYSWQCAVDRALRYLEQSEESLQPKTGLYKIASADPEPPSPAPSARSSVYFECDEIADGHSETTLLGSDIAPSERSLDTLMPTPISSSSPAHHTPGRLDYSAASSLAEAAYSVNSVATQAHPTPMKSSQNSFSASVRTYPFV
ncbi:hypothetical protein NM688_g3232 [Phlebia brevispora]|uniref:Uncharacterized protein n=1 Tax=Phlebia brevispora TaxID=194682 RepID=A0ACC1T6C7_9APHY|nr:hypothetical protein NM688_g3232 [Phlebia brevispora]